MKTLFYCSIILLIITGCSKHATDNSTTSFTGNWNLIKSVWMEGGKYTTYPAKDSAVSLILSTDYTYQSKLNNVVVSKGNYTAVSTGLDSFYQRDLKLQNFQSTGIFKPLVLFQEDATGQIISVDTTNFFMAISQDTMTLTPDVITPGGQNYYYFVKQH